MGIAGGGVVATAEGGTTVSRAGVVTRVGAE